MQKVLSKFLSAFTVFSMLVMPLATLTALPNVASADVGNPGAAFTTTYNPVTDELTVSGTYSGAPNNASKKPGFATFINGNTPLTTSLDTLVNLLPQTVSGTFSKTYTSVTTIPTKVCVAIYDTNFPNPPATGGHGMKPADAGINNSRNDDNSWEKNNVFPCTTTSILITKINDTNPPFSFTCPANPLLNPVTVSGNGFGQSPPGHTSQYHVQLDWGDGTTTDVTETSGIGAFSTGDGAFGYTYSGSHTYTTGGNFVIKARLYHSTPPGNDNQADTVATVTVCVVVKPTLTLQKTVVGGPALDTSFTLSASGPTPISGVEGNAAVTNAAVTAGAYTLSESGGPAGYTASTYSCVKNGGAAVISNSLTLANGDSAVCTITNTAIAPTLTLNKTVDNGTTGGTATAANFQGKIDGNNVAWGTPITLSAGAHTASEVNLPGYTPTNWGGDCATNGGITLALGDAKTCTITNTAQQAYVKVDVTVNNDNGGTASPNNFLPTLNGNGVTDETSNPVNPGNYPVSYTDLPGYTAGSWGGNCEGGNVTAVLGTTKICTITFSDNAPKLTLNKILVQDNGGLASIASFILKALGPVELSGPGANGDNDVVSGGTFQAGNYVLSETENSGYTASTWDCSNEDNDGTISIGLGDDVNCTITNDDKQAKLTVTKIVQNNDGGELGVSDFTLYVDDEEVTSGAENLLDAGKYTVSEDDEDGYVGVIGGDCDANGDVTLLPGDDKECTITNSDVAAGLTVIKQITNNNGGTSVVADFALTVTGSDLVPNAFTSGAGENLPADTYVVTETGPAGYQSTFSGDCDSDGKVTLEVGDTKVCTITNDDIAPSLTLVKEVVKDNGGTAVAADWTLSANGDKEVSTDISGAGGATSDGTFLADTYTLSETTGPAGYTAGSWSCSGVENVGNQVTLSLGQSATCTIVNNDNAPSLTLTKNVVGGDADAEDWTLTASGPTPISGAGGANSDATFDAGTYTLSESTGPDNYNPAAFWQCEGGNMNETNDQITLGLGQSASCSITNTYVPVVYECSDGVDTEGEADELADEMDPGCHTDRDVNNTSSYDPFDDDESNEATECSDGVNNNDVDNLVDSNDPACHTDGDASDDDDTYDPDDTDEATECSDDADNGDAEDSLSDQNDPGCHTDGNANDEDEVDTYDPNDTSETDNETECNDGNNNDDNDILADAADPDCHTDGDNTNDESYDPTDDDEDGEESGGGRSSGGGSRPTGEVLGAATEICNWDTQYLRRGWYKNVPGDVETMQNFLNLEMASNLVVDRMFGPKTEAAVKAFQAKYKADILTPWGINSPTGIWYLSTTTKAKEIMCGEKTALPPLVNWSQNPAVR
jgi:hypothetical protein